LRMRGVLWGVLGTLLAFLCVARGSQFPKILSIDSEHTVRVKTALQNMDIKKVFQQMQESDIASKNIKSDQSPGLVSSNAAGFGNPTCDPGFTGGDCEYPICDVANRHDHENPISEKITVDFYYATNSTQKFWVYVDLTMQGQEFQLQSDSGPIFPKMSLINATGSVFVASEQTNGPEESVYTYFYLPPGVYMVQLNADDPIGSMLFTYNAWTYLSTEIGGIPYNGYEDSAKRNDFPTYNLTFFTNIPTLFVAASVGLEFPGTLSTISFMSSKTPSSHNIKLLLRYGCHYPYFTGEFHCPAEGYYFARIRGYDFEGHSFVRTHSYICEIGMPPTTVAPSTTTTSPSGNITCFNGGARITFNGTQYCFCEGLYTGPYCGTPLCMNGGIAQSSICICPDGYSGSHCQNIQCTDDAGSGFLVGSPILTFVVRARTSMSSVISQISSAVQQITSELEYDPPYVSKFGLVLFNNNSTTTNMYYTAADMINALNTAAQTTDNSGNCTDFFFIPVLQALTNFIISNKSPIYVVSDGLPQDLALAEEVSRLNSYFNAPINFIYIEPDLSTGCPPFDYESPGFRAVAEISFRFSGIATFVGNAEKSNVKDLLYTYMANTYHKSHLMFSDDQRVCQNIPKYITISVDALFHQLTVVVEGSNVSTVQFNAPDGTVVPASGNYTLGGVSIYWLTGLQVGTWTVVPVVLSINFPCSVRAYAVEDPSPTVNGQDYHMVYGITPDLNLDAPERQPLLGLAQSIVAHIENYRFVSPWSVDAEIIVFTDGGGNSGGRNLVMASNGVWRDGCSFEIWFPPFHCVREGINLYFVIYVKDDRQNQIQRSGVFYCAANRVTPPPSPGTCANGGIPTNGTCLCQPGWTGDYCTTRVCYNNGTLNPAGYCQCPPGTGGESCEFLRCIEQNQRTDFSIHNRHMLFVLDITNRNAAPLVDLNKYITELIRDIASSHRDWISRYFVLGIDSSGSQVLGSAFGGDVGRIQAIFQNASNIASNSTDSSTNIPIFEGLMRHMYELNSKSFINIFSTAAPDQSNVSNIIDATDYVISSGHLLNTYAATDANGAYMSGTDSDWDMLKSLTQMSTGRFMKLRQSNFYYGLKLIPSWYSSQVVYYKSFDDCTYNGSIFAPVDSFAQSIQIYLNGQNAGNTGASSTLYVQLPNGTLSSLPSAVLTDSANGFAVYDVRRPCDAGWESGGPSVPYCFQAFLSNQTWNAARQICTDAGGFLVDDMNQAKDDFISSYTNNKQIWIGLHALNGTWMWDRGIGQPSASYDGSTFGPWADGSSNVDPSKPCVYRGTDKKWYKFDCDTTGSLYVCQKYQYTQEFIPNEINDDDVPAGRWQISFSSPGQCTIEVRVQSSLLVYSGFVTHVLDDFALPDGISNSTDNRAISHLVGIASINHIPYLRYAQIMDAANGSLYAAATYDYRIGCTYEYLSQNFICPNSGDIYNRFAVIHIGEDESGYPFQRITTGVCQAPRTTCRNGLYWNGQCVCDEYYQGTYCEVPICVNGGLLNTADNTCQCPAAFGGPNCQFPFCPRPQNVTFTNDGKAFVVVLEATTQNQAAVQNFGSNLTTTLNNILGATSSNWFSQYILVTFDSTRVLHTSSSQSIDDFVNNYNTNTATLSSNNACDLPIFGAIAAAAMSNLPSQSIMYLITTGGSSQDDGTNNGFNAFNAAANTDVMINYIIINSDACQNEVTSGGSMGVSEISVGTDGNTFLIDPNEITNFANAHLPTLYNGSVIGTPSLSGGAHQCKETIFYFSLESYVQTVYLYIYAEYGAPAVTTPDTSTASVQPFYTDNNLFFYSFTPNGQGIYTLSISDPGTCMVQVRTKGGLEVYPSFLPVLSINATVSVNFDNSTAIPSVGSNLVALHVSDSSVEVQYARFWPTTSAIGEIQYIQFYRRFNCFYEWYSDPFNCDEDGYFITVFGITSRGAPWARQFYTRCNGYNGTSTLPPPTTASGQTTAPPPTTSPGQTTPPPPTTTSGPTTTTSPGQTTTTSKYYPVIADVVFVFDISTAVSSAQFQDSKNFILNALNQFNVGYQKGVQIGMFSVYGDDENFVLQVSGFNGISDYNSLGNALNNAYPADAANSGSGQGSLVQALKLIMAPGFKGTGYRNTTQNHVIVYITTSSTPNQPAIDQAGVILKDGSYKIVAISYQGDGSNTNALQQLVGGNAGCVLSSATADDYTGAFAQSFADKLLNANGNGNYC